MKNNTYVTSLIFFLSVLIANAQTNDFYYTVNNEKIHLIKIEGKSLVEFPIGLSTTTPLSGPGIKLTDKTFIVSNLENLSGYDSPYLLTPTYITDDGIELNYSREILLKFNSNTSPSLKSNLISSNNLIPSGTTTEFTIGLSFSALATIFTIISVIEILILLHS